MFKSLRLWRLKPDFKTRVQQAEALKAKTAPEWEKREALLRKRYGSWNPTRKLSRLQIADIKDLKVQAPHLKTVQIAEFFGMNPEGVRRILKLNWEPSDEEVQKLNERAERRKQKSIERKETFERGLKTVSEDNVVFTKNRTARGGRRPPKDWRGKDKGNKSKDKSKAQNRMYTDSVGDIIE